MGGFGLLLIDCFQGGQLLFVNAWSPISTLVSKSTAAKTASVVIASTANVKREDFMVSKGSEVRLTGYLQGIEVTRDGLFSSSSFFGSTGYIGVSRNLSSSVTPSGKS